MLCSVAMSAVAGQALALTDDERQRLDAFRTDRTPSRLAAHKASKEADFRAAQRIWEEIAADCEVALGDVKPCSEFYGHVMDAARQAGDDVMYRIAEAKWRVGVFVASSRVPATADEANRRAALGDKTLDVVAAEAVLKRAIVEPGGAGPLPYAAQSEIHATLTLIYLSRRDMANVAIYASRAAELAERADNLRIASAPAHARQREEVRWFWSRANATQLANALEKAGYYAAAETILRALVTYEPERSRWIVMGRVADTVIRQGRQDEAAIIFRQALAQQRLYYAPTHPGLIAGYGHLARLYARLPDGAAMSRTLLRLEDRALRARIKSFPSFDDAARREMDRAGRDYRLAVKINWQLSRR